MLKLKAVELSGNRQDKIFETPECQKLLDIYDGIYTKNGYDYPWVAYLILKENQIVGSCGFTGKPVDGAVEIAYWTFEEYEGQGIASFACKELVSIAKEEKPHMVLTAKTAPEKNASTKILEKNGFVYTKIVQDEEIGDAWLWTLQV